MVMREATYLELLMRAVRFELENGHIVR